MTTKPTNHLDDTIAQRVHDAGDRLIELKNDVAKQVERRVDTLGTLIREHPFAALGIGLGVGYLVGRLVHR